VVDRFDRRLVMIAADAGAAVVTVAVIMLWVAGDLAAWHLVVSTFAVNLFISVQQPAYSAAIPSLVGSGELDRANGLIQIGPSVGAVVVPGLAGALVAWIGADSIGVIFVVDLATFLIGIATAAAVRFGGLTDPAAGESFRLMAAVRWLRSDGRSLVALTLVLAAVNVALSGVSVAMVAWAQNLGGDAAVGLGPTAGGAGMVVVSLVLGARGIPKRRRIPAMGLALVGFGVLLAVSVATPSLPLFVVCVGLGISTMPFVVSTVRTVFLQWAPPYFMGRVFGVLGAATTVAEPVGLVAAVPLLAWSISGFIAVAGAVLVVLGIVVALNPTLRVLNHPPAVQQ
jgi:DHA3 family macrolide efflux protein-like MFS transporter